MDMGSIVYTIVPIIIIREVLFFEELCVIKFGDFL